MAEDEVLIRMMALDVLTDKGFEVIEAGHTEEAVAILESQAADIHVLFTDIHMPGPMDRLELTRAAMAVDCAPISFRERKTCRNARGKPVFVQAV